MTLLNKEAAKSKVKRLLYDYFAIPLCHIRIFKIIPRTNFVQKQGEASISGRRRYQLELVIDKSIFHNCRPYYQL